MRVPLSWLREYVDFEQTPEELVELFSMHSQEVEGIHRLGVLDGEVVVGEVREFGRHPNADRLFVAKVDIGGRTVQIVAGAGNPRPGARVPVVLPGSTLAGVGKVRKARLRGLESYGMMMSERELGISGDHEGILLLDEGYEVGRPLSDYLPVGETVLDIDVMPNRPDLWGMIGVARELAAILRTGFRIPRVSFEAGGEPTAAYGLRVEAGELCPRYDLRRVSGVRPGLRSPLLVRRRIYAAGMRPINAVVDATNYVMLETGQPIHAFDAAKVRGGIVVRRAREGEKITLLDGSVRTLDPEMLVIADEERALVIAGVMGAEDAEVDDGTSDVLIEVATFEGRNILKTSARLGLRTDASGRFERGLDPNMVDYALQRVVGMLVEHTGGRAAPDTLSHYPRPARPWRVELRLERAGLLLGMPVREGEAREVLGALGCEVAPGERGLAVTVPTFRQDLRREADLVEELGRLIGLERVPEHLPATALPGGLTADQRRVRLLRRLLADLGLSEAMLYPFGPDRWARDLGYGGSPLRVENPLSAEGRCLRVSMLPGLLDAAARNRAFGASGGGIFEVGHVFLPVPVADGEAARRFREAGERPGGVGEPELTGVREEPRLGVLLAGVVRPGGWNVPALRAGFFEARGLVERLVPGAAFEPGGEPFLHPGRSARVVVEGRRVGWVGELHPEVAERFELEGWPVAALELELAACKPDPEPRFRPFFNVPAVNRDLAVVVDASVPAGGMLEDIRALGGPLLAGARVFDVYTGEQVPEGKKSVAFSLTFQADRTLTDEEVDAEVERIAARLNERFGAEVRGG
ncbi:phenylalanyl-tRNA synthetase beta subunit [Rubrobacter xylanophilus DSM 9941]|uniref:Phenylalanine--tRNA ligase beta subunit n=1 Tax=Rubrobacter xylanophilus (strain DSM 9941 / JCM 11954 / NBRC 16129 / PRD-1) TaxID=266117 RepID=Q1AWF8_RUBXD|nr:phenylalanine--tRNA ligase subunit beta [Rubrobacter xylanophilus]ABG04270.1 phenylalanyl-tRNA synthetase beta subunit [Rubrobacter xylanophilus DSM 9941]